MTKPRMVALINTQSNCKSIQVTLGTRHYSTFLIRRITLYLAVVPDCKSDSMFPGSRYAMLIRNPGPVNAHSFRKLNPSCKNKKKYLNTYTGVLSAGTFGCRAHQTHTVLVSIVFIGQTYRIRFGDVNFYFFFAFPRRQSGRFGGAGMRVVHRGLRRKRTYTHALLTGMIYTWI